MAGCRNPQPPKRHRDDDVSAIIAATGLQLATQAREHGVSRRRVGNELHKHDNVATPHGNLFSTVEVVAPRADPLVVDCVNPFAFMWYAAHISPDAGSFFERWLSGKVCRIAFYK